MKKALKRDVMHVQPSMSSSTFCNSSSSDVTRISLNVMPVRRSPRVSMGRRRRGVGSDVEAIALPLGMSIAAVVAQVLEKRDPTSEGMTADHLSMICTSAVRESLTNVFGGRFNSFIANFEKSFRSTLSTLSLIKESSIVGGECCSSCLTKESVSSDMNQQTSYSTTAQSEITSPIGGTQEQQPDIPVEIEQTDYRQQADQQLARVSPSIVSSLANPSVLGTFERSLVEHTRANDLKTFEISLLMRKLQMKERKLALDSDSNLLERIKLSIGISKASFKAEKFKNQLEDARHSELLRKCIDCLVAGLFVTLASLGYGAYVHSYKRITDATAICTPPEKSKSWWIPKSMASFNSGLHSLTCQIQVISRMLFGMLMILAIAYLLLQRSAASKQTMPITFILLMLGVGCGLAGKFCVDTLGGNGFHWVLYWEALCLLHFLSNMFTPALFLVLHGPVSVAGSAKGCTVFPYCFRRFLFYAVVLLFLPLLCGLMPFAGPTEWGEHFLLLLEDYLPVVVV